MSTDRRASRQVTTATIHDVARLAQVSAATVSRVVSGNRTVSPDYVDRVRRAVAELDYEPSRLARGLRTQRTRVWGLVISDIRNPFFTDMVRGIEDVASATDHALVLCNSDEDLAKERDYLELIVSERMAGAILAPADSARSDCSAVLNSGIPVVTVDRRLTDADVDAVVVDNVAGAAIAVEHLAAQGFRRIGCITGPQATTTGGERLQGYRQAVSNVGQELDPELVVVGDFKEASGAEGARHLLGLARPPDAIFCANNLMSLGMLRAISELGLGVPGDVALATFDDPEWAALVQPALTGVAQPVYEMGRIAAELLLRRIDGDTSPGEVVRLPPQLVARASSTGPPRTT